MTGKPETQPNLLELHKISRQFGTDAEVQSATDAIVAALAADHGARLR